MGNGKYSNSIKTKILGIVFLSVFIVIAILGYLSFSFSRMRLTSMISDSIRGVAATTASFIKTDDILLIRLYSDGIRERYMSTSSPPYARIYEKMGETGQLAGQDKLNEAISAYVKNKDLLTNIKKLNNIDSPINIYVADNGALRLILTTENLVLTSVSYALRPEADKALSTGLAESTGVYHDKDGTWISAYAPVPAVYSDKDKILVEINCKIDSYIGRLRKELGLIILVCLAGFLIATLIAYRLVTALVYAIKRLDAAASELENENYHTPIDVKSDDEVGHLAHTFEKLRSSIANKISELKLSIIREKKAHLESVVALTNAIEERDP